MTPAQRHLLVAVLERAAELWIAGDVDAAVRWSRIAWSIADDAGLDSLDGLEADR